MIVTPGTLLGGRYEVLKRIATGGMATVHLARAVGAGGFERLVAVKVMHPQFATEAEFVTMFLDEARLAARIRHPNVVPTLDMQVSAEELFLVMEFIDGPSLSHLRKAAGPEPLAVPLGVVLRIMIDTLAGLHAAHELSDDEGRPLSLIHRDVSPMNVLVGLDGIARITDFGVARAEARLSSTRGGQLKGKLPYMPPEQLMNELLDRRTDVFAAGAVLWELLVGRRLFTADSDGALLTKILTGAYTSPRQVHAAIPESVDRAVMRALAPARENRYPTAAAFAEALELAAEEANVSVASTRAVASFVETSGAHHRLDLKEVARLKRARTEADAPNSANVPMIAAKSEFAAEPSSAPSTVTAADVAMSTRPRPAKRSHAPIIVAAVAVLGGAIGGIAYVGTHQAQPLVAGSATTTPTTALSTAATATGVATQSPAVTASTKADTSVPSANLHQDTSASAQSQPARGVKTPPKTATPPTQPTTKPTPTAYEPDRL